MKGKIVAIMLFIGCVMPIMTMYTAFRIQKFLAYIHFSNQKESYPEEQILTLRVTGESDFHWERKENEFSLNGKLYDVLSIETITSGMVIRCVADKKEDKLVVNYLKSFARSHRQQNDRTKLPKVKVNLVGKYVFVFRIPEILYNEIAIILDDKKLVSPALKICLPPPKPFSYHIVG